MKHIYKSNVGHELTYETSIACISTIGFCLIDVGTHTCKFKKIRRQYNLSNHKKINNNISVNFDKIYWAPLNFAVNLINLQEVLVLLNSEREDWTHLLKTNNQINTNSHTQIQSTQINT